MLAEAGISQDDVPIVERHINDQDNSRSAAEELLDAHPELTAVICTVDSMALAVADVVESRGGTIPRDLSVTGFDGIPQAVNRGIVTVRQPSKDKGRSSGEVLASNIEQTHNEHTGRIKKRGAGTEATRILLETSVMDGESIGAPRTGATE